MSIVLVLYVAVLFFVLTPGVFISLPPKADNLTVVLTHAVLFAAVYQLTYKMVDSIEGFANKRYGQTYSRGQKLQTRGHKASSRTHTPTRGHKASSRTHTPTRGHKASSRTHTPTRTSSRSNTPRARMSSRSNTPRASMSRSNTPRARTSSRSRTYTPSSAQKQKNYRTNTPSSMKKHSRIEQIKSRAQKTKRPKSFE